MPRQEIPLVSLPQDNNSAPRFIALCFDEYVDADYNLDELLRVLADLADANDPEDVAIWDGHRLAAVVRGDGTVTRFDAPETPQATPEPRSANGRPKRRG